ncbi:MAG: hypothetical protein ABIJ96_00730 [Elusimicrobiota bacterium]
MSLLGRLFSGWGGAGKPRGWSPRNPLLSAGPADARAMLESWTCAKGHRLEISRRGSVEGACPDSPGHAGGAGAGGCIVDAYAVSCALCREPVRIIFVDGQHPVHPEQTPPAGLRGAPPLKGPARTITLDYEDTRPAWRLKTVQPSRFRGVRYQVQTRLFLMPEGALIGLLFNLYDIPNQPYFIHRIMDLSDPEVDRYVDACVRCGSIVTIFESKGEEAGFRRDIELDAEEWRACLDEGREHNASIETDGSRALEIFLDVFHRISRERGVEPAWDEIARRCAPRRK